jgi:hypothetical protein
LILDKEGLSLSEIKNILKSNGLSWVNPYGEVKPIHYYSDNPSEELSEMYQKALKDWQEAENKRIKGKLIILKKL